MSALSLKIIAAMTMLLDHIGFMFFPDQIIFRIIGRIAFPIFAFLIVEGYLHTSNVKKYAVRLIVAAAVSEIPFNLFVYHKVFSWKGQNVIFTLFLGLIAIWIIDKFFDKHKFITMCSTLLCCFVAYSIHSDYDVLGVLLIVGLFALNKNKFLSVGMLAIFNCGYGIIRDSYVQCAAAFAAFPIYFYNEKPGKYKLKWFFYIFYPLHMLILYLFSLYIR